MALSPRSGRELCADMPAVEIFQKRPPRCARTMSRLVGSPTIAPSAVTLEAASVSAPVLPASSSTVAASTSVQGLTDSRDTRRSVSSMAASRALGVAGAAAVEESPPRRATAHARVSSRPGQLCPYALPASGPERRRRLRGCRPRWGDPAAPLGRRPPLRTIRRRPRPWPPLPLRRCLPGISGDTLGVRTKSVRSSMASCSLAAGSPRMARMIGPCAARCAIAPMPDASSTAAAAAVRTPLGQAASDSLD